MASKTIIALAGSAFAASLMLMGCEDMGYHHHDGLEVGVGVDVDPGSVDYDGYYDDYYGPVADGYWGTDGAFYYTDAIGHPYRRGDAAHFRHDAAEGFHAMHGHHNGHPRP